MVGEGLGEGGVINRPKNIVGVGACCVQVRRRVRSVSRGVECTGEEREQWQLGQIQGMFTKIQKTALLRYMIYGIWYMVYIGIWYTVGSTQDLDFALSYDCLPA